MPFYEYECSNCRFYVEVLQKISEKPLKKCPSCGKPALKKLVSAPVFRLKGSGWYETDFKSDQEGKRNLAGADKEEASTQSKDEAKAKPEAEAKPATEGEAKVALKADAKSEPKSDKKADPKSDAAAKSGKAHSASKSVKHKRAAPAKAAARKRSSPPAKAAGKRRRGR